MEADLDWLLANITLGGVEPGLWTVVDDVASGQVGGSRRGERDGELILEKLEGTRAVGRLSWDERG